MKQTRRHKYNAKQTIVDNIKFASKAESKRYSELKYLERAKTIYDLELQPRFKLIVNDKLICTYVPDFQYKVTGVDGIVIEDVKGMKTDVYKIKAKLFTALYPDLNFREIEK